VSGPTKRLYRSRTERKIAGVCGGLAAYLGVDPVIPRILWVVLALGGGLGIVAYLICWLVIPLEPATVQG
jgi:phage shock protein PspC (stress-responsive transcriptional regulator)